MKPPDQRTRELAYQIWETEGKPVGQETRHWEMARKLAEAEADIDSEAKSAPRTRRTSQPKTTPVGETEQPAVLKKPRTARPKTPRTPES